MTSDHHFPRFHIRPPSGFINDPNGPVLIDGRVHLYFQYRPATDQNCPVFWGHASSDDLVRWVVHRAAIAPDPSGPDWGGAWSGNTIALGDSVRAFYSAYVPGHPYQSVVAADSGDGGFSFGPARHVVADPEPGEQIVTYRDPFVWRVDDGWRMAVGAGAKGGLASARQYSSSDLDAWTFDGNLAELPRTVREDGALDTGEMWECPQVITVGGTTILVVSCWSETEGIMRVMSVVGSAETIPMSSPRFARYDQGTDFYAASALRESGVGPVLWGWATEGRDQGWATEADWSGVLTLPRRISLDQSGEVCSEPVDALVTARRARHEASAAAPVTVGAQFEIEARFASRAAAPTIRLRFSDSEHLDVVVDAAARDVTVDRSSASADTRAHGGYATILPPAGSSGELGLRIFVDGSIVEVFTSDGRCATLRFYPVAPPPWTVEVSAAAEHDEVTVWELAPTIAGPAAGGGR